MLDKLVLNALLNETCKKYMVKAQFKL